MHYSLSSRLVEQQQQQHLCVFQREEQRRRRVVIGPRTLGEERERESDETLLRATLGRSLSHFFLFFVVLPPTLFFFADGADDARCNSNLLWEMEEEQKRV